METRTVRVNKNTLRYNIDGRELVTQILQAMEREDTNVYQANPGFTAVASLVGYDSSQVRSAKAKIAETAKVIAQRIEQGMTYVERIAIGHDRMAGRATAFLNNAIRAAYRPDDLEAAQSPWKTDAKTGLLITEDGIEAFFRTAAALNLEIETGNGNLECKPAAAWLRQLPLEQFAAAEVQAFNVACATAEEGALTAANLADTFGTLNQEAAPVDEAELQVQRTAAVRHIGEARRVRQNTDGRTAAANA